MVIVCDTFDWEDYPVFVGPDEDVVQVADNYRKNMQRVMEVYQLDLDKELQLGEYRAFHYGKKELD
jgi:hypothetical protein